MGAFDKKKRAEIVDQLKMLEGLPPHSGFNPCRGDGYFANSIVQQYGMVNFCSWGRLEQYLRRSGTIKRNEELVGFVVRDNGLHIHLSYKDDEPKNETRR